MSQFDVAIGMDESTLNRGAGELYAKDDARKKIFMGQQQGESSGKPFTAKWDVQAPPTFTLSAPSDDLWTKSVDAQGNNPKLEDKPKVNAFQLVFPQFYGEYTLGSAAPVSGTTKVIVIATIATTGSTATITPLSVWIDQSRIGGWDRLILNKFILPQVLKQAGQMLAGFKLPPLVFKQGGAVVELTPPQVAVVSSRLVLAASLKSVGSVDIGGVQWPTQPFFLLLSPRLVDQVTTQLAQKFVGTEKSDKGDYKSLVTWQYRFRLDSVQVQSNPSDMTKIGAPVGFSFSASADPFGVSACGAKAATGSL